MRGLVRLRGLLNSRDAEGRKHSNIANTTSKGENPDRNNIFYGKKWYVKKVREEEEEEEEEKHQKREEAAASGS